jgi:hypothetical protein
MRDDEDVTARPWTPREPAGSCPDCPDHSGCPDRSGPLGEARWAALEVVAALFKVTGVLPEHERRQHLLEALGSARAVVVATGYALTSPDGGGRVTWPDGST